MGEGFIIIGDSMKEGFMYDFLAGIDYFGFSGGHLAKWLAGIVFLLFGAGLWLEEKRKIMPFEMVRFESRKQWWNARFRDLFLKGTAGCVLYAFCMMGLDCLSGKTKPDGAEEIWILLLWLVHMMVIVSMFCVLSLTKMRTAAAALLFVTEVSSFIVGFYLRNLSKYMFGCWGMYRQSSLEEALFGFSPAAVLILESLMILAARQFGMKMLERRDIKWNI